MNLRQLEYFCAIAEEHQITAAARRLHISQPPLSYELSQLERELGCTLVNRSSHGTELTEAGRVLYERARQMLDLAEETRNEVANVGLGLAGTLSVGIISSSGGQVPSERLIGMFRGNGRVHLQLREGNTYEVLDMLRRGIVELGVVRTPFQQEGFECSFAQPESMVAVMPEGLVRGKDEGSVTLAELAGVPLVIYRRFERILGDLFQERGIEPYFACVNDDARTTCVWASRGMGIGLVPASFLSLLKLGGCVVKRVDEEALVTRMCVVWPEKRRLSPLAQRFVELVWE